MLSTIAFPRVLNSLGSSRGGTDLRGGLGRGAGGGRRLNASGGVRIGRGCSAELEGGAGAVASRAAAPAATRTSRGRAAARGQIGWLNYV
jgi:hypothetical protein